MATVLTCAIRGVHEACSFTPRFMVGVALLFFAFALTVILIAGGRDR